MKRMTPEEVVRAVEERRAREKKLRELPRSQQRSDPPRTRLHSADRAYLEKTQQSYTSNVASLESVAVDEAPESAGDWAEAEALNTPAAQARRNHGFT